MKLLMIAGMGESVGLAHELSAIAGHEVICIPQGRSVARAKPPAKIYDGTFETDADFAQYIAQQGFDMVIDAAHPFDVRLGAVAQGLGLPYLRVQRDPWQAKPGENWHHIGCVNDAIPLLPHGARLFLATGRGSVHAFAPRTDVHVMCRQLMRHDRAFPLANGQYVFGEGPFSIQQEIDLFQSLKVEYLLLRNSGSVEGRSKLDAATALGLQVIMIDQPDLGFANTQMAKLDQVVKKVKHHADH